MAAVPFFFIRNHLRNLVHNFSPFTLHFSLKCSALYTPQAQNGKTLSVIPGLCRWEIISRSQERLPRMRMASLQKAMRMAKQNSLSRRYLMSCEMQDFHSRML